MIRAAVVVSLLLVVACKKQDASPGALAPLPPDGAGARSGSAAPADPTPPPTKMSDADFDALMTQTMAFFEKVGVSIEAADADCARMASGIETVVAEHDELMARVRAMDSDPDIEDRSEAWMRAHADAVEPALTKIRGGITRCGEDAAVQAAFEKMSGK